MDEKSFKDQISNRYNQLNEWFNALINKEPPRGANYNAWFKEGQYSLIVHELNALKNIIRDVELDQALEGDQRVGGFWRYLGKKYDPENLTQRIDEALKDEKFRYITRYGAQVLYTVVTKLAIVMSKLKVEPFLTSSDTPYGMTKPLPDMDWIEKDIKNPDIVLHNKEERALHLAIEKASVYPLVITMIPFLLAEAAELSKWLHGVFDTFLGAHGAHLAMGASVGAGLVSVAILQWGLVVLTAIELSHASKKSTLEGLLEDRVGKLSSILSRLEDKTKFIDPSNLQTLIAQKNELEKEINSALNVANAIIHDNKNNKEENGFEWSKNPVTEIQINGILEPLKQHYQSYSDDSTQKKVNIDNWKKDPKRVDNEQLKEDKLRVSRPLMKQRRSQSALMLSLFGYIALAVGATMLAAITIIGAPVVLPVLGTVATMAPYALLGTGVTLNLVASITNRWDRRQTHLDREALFIRELEQLVSPEDKDSPRALFVQALKNEMEVDIGKRHKNRGVLTQEMLESVKDDYELFQVLDANRKAWPALLKNTVNWNTQKEEWIKEFEGCREKYEGENPQEGWRGGFFKPPPRNEYSDEKVRIINDLIRYFKEGKGEILTSLLDNENIKKPLSSLSESEEFSRLIEKHKDLLPNEWMKAWREAKVYRGEEEAPGIPPPG